MSENSGRNEHPIDEMIRELMQNANDAGYGWALGLAREGDTPVSTEAGAEESSVQGPFRIGFDVKLPPVDEYEGPPHWRAHEFGTPGAIADYVKHFMDAEAQKKGVVFYDDVAIQLVVDEKAKFDMAVGTDRGRREIMTHRWVYAADYLQWLAIIGRPQSYVWLRKNLPLLAHTMVTPDLLAALRNIKYSEETKHDSEIREIDGEASYGIVFHVKGQNDTVHNIPRQFQIHVPILREDVLDKANWQTIDFKVEVQMPEAPNQPLNLLLLSPAFEEYRLARLDKAMVTLKAALGDDVLVVCGKHTELARELGNADRFEHAPGHQD